MKVISFMRQSCELVPVEVELSLSPGLPQIIVMGLPDAMIRESVGRIKSALKHQGFDLPAARQVFVHLRPTHIKKTSRGLDLAVAAALLWETGQIPAPDPDAGPPRVYGELSLKGEIFRPDDLEDLPAESAGALVLTGDGPSLPFAVGCAKDLRGIASPVFKEGVSEVLDLEPPRIPEIRVHRDAADVIAAVVAGEHHVLLAGPPGSGKTTIAELIPALCEEPDPSTFAQSRRIHRVFDQKLNWRPVVQPHHSASSLAMIGGGVPPRPGEITRAHGGFLIMDEFLEFETSVQEALREPLQSGEISLARGGQNMRYPAKFLLVGTTNLCPCGRYLPGRDELCRCSRARRTPYFARLRGPFIDRFAMLAYTQGWSHDLEVSAMEIKERIDRAIEFRRARGQGVPNARLREEDVLGDLTAFQKENLFPKVIRSRRRLLSFLRVARTFADLDEAEKIRDRHLDLAARFSVQTFMDLERVDV